MTSGTEVEAKNPKRKRTNVRRRDRAVRGIVRQAVEAAMERVANGESAPPPGANRTEKQLHDIAVAALEAAKSATYRQGDLARALCEAQHLANVAFWTAMRDGLISGCTAADMLRASENIANRGGMPPLSQQEVRSSTVAAKLYDLEGSEPGVPVAPAAPALDGAVEQPVEAEEQSA